MLIIGYKKKKIMVMALISLIVFFSLLFGSLWFVFDGTGILLNNVWLYVSIAVAYILIVAIIYFFKVRKIVEERTEKLKMMSENPELLKDLQDEFGDMDPGMLAKYGTVALLLFNTRPSNIEILYHNMTPDFKDNILLVIAVLAAYLLYPPMFEVPEHGYAIAIFISLNFMMLEFSRWGYSSVQHMLKETQKKIEELMEKEKPSKWKLWINKITFKLFKKRYFSEEIDLFEIKSPFVLSIRVFPLIIATIFTFWSYRASKEIFLQYK